MNDAGRIGFVICGDYDNTVQYDFLDVVYYHGNSYVAKKLTLGNIPNENNEYWHILAAGGVRVKGDAETEYRDGDVNITKENIGLGNAENKSSETIRGEITSENVTNALGYTPTNTKVKGNAETEYRTGEVNLTPENIGAVDKAEFEKRFAMKQTVFNTVDDFPVVGSGFGVNTEPLTLYDGFAIPAYARICFMNYINSADATLIAVGSDGTYTAIRRAGIWKNGKVLVSRDNIMQGATASIAGKAGLVPAPKAQRINDVLFSSGNWLDDHCIFSTLTNVPQETGWHRIYEISDSSFGGNGECGIIAISRNYESSNNESLVLSFASSHKGSEECFINWHTIQRIINLKIIEKIRIAKYDNKIYFEIYVNKSGNRYSCKIFSSSTRDFSLEKKINFEPATSDETVVSEYTIPDKDDFDTSKSLTRFEEIPSGADLKSDKYLVPGNYCCPLTDIAHSLVNCPINTAFSLEVKYAVGTTAYIEQAFYEIYSSKIVKRSRLYDGTWTSNSIYYPITGTPPANKLWGTDANGNVGWIDPPP